MDELKWLLNDGSWHAFAPGRTRSLCSRSPMPVDWVTGTDVYVSRCAHCQRLVVQKLFAERAAVLQPAVQWREVATRAALGDGWAYADIENMPTWRETVDRMAVALADAFRQGLVQGGTERTGST